MEILKIAKYLAWDVTSFERVSIGRFVDFLEGKYGILDSDVDFNYYKAASGWNLSHFYFNVLSRVRDIEQWGDTVISAIIAEFNIPIKSPQQPGYREVVKESDFTEYNLADTKSGLLSKIESEIKRLNWLKGTKYNKEKGNDFERLCEEFLLCTSYFSVGLTEEMAFEDDTEKIDRLLRLESDICNFNKWLTTLGYVILEAKYKIENSNGASEVAQLASYIKRLKKYGVSRYAIVITSKKFKQTYKTKLGNEIFDLVSEKEFPFYTAIITTEEIIKFLQPGNLMSFDEFIERQFIKWLK